MASPGPLLPHALRDPILTSLLSEHRSRVRQTAHSLPATDSKLSSTGHTDSTALPANSQPPQTGALATDSNQEVILFLDYDGTLAPIVSDPSQAQLAQGMIPVLRACGQASAQGAGIRIVIISGRSVSKVRNFLSPLGTRAMSNIIVAGSHGYDVQWAVPREGVEAGSTHTNVNLPSEGYQPFAHMLPLLSKARDAVAARLITTGVTGVGMVPGAGLAAGQFAGASLGIPGVEIEDNRYSITIHWRNTPVEHHATVEQVVRDVAAHMNGLEVRPGKMVWELRPAVQWGKGQAVQHILTRVLQIPPTPPPSMPASTTTGPLVVCIGDDHTDEDMFNCLRDLCGPTAAAAGSERLQAMPVPILVATPLIEDSQGNASVQSEIGVPVLPVLPAGVHSHSARMPRPTAAQWYLHSPADVRNFLAWVVGTLAEEQAEAVTQMNTADVHPQPQEPGMLQQ